MTGIDHCRRLPTRVGRSCARALTGESRGLSGRGWRPGNLSWRLRLRLRLRLGKLSCRQSLQPVDVGRAAQPLLIGIGDALALFGREVL
jgi:hypothetical protein